VDIKFTEQVTRILKMSQTLKVNINNYNQPSGYRFYRSAQNTFP
jgi:hypothetical protein